MRKYNDLFLLILILIICSYSVKGQNQVIGIYTYCKKTNNNDILQEVLSLKEDSTFTFTYKHHLINTSVNGFWRIQGNELILVSDKLINEECIKVTESYNPDASFKIINVEYVKGAPLEIVNFELIGTGSFKINLDENGKSILKTNGDISVINITFQTLGGPITYVYNMKNKKANNLTIKLSLVEDRYYRYFQEEMWIIKYKYIKDKSNRKFRKY